MSGALKTTIRYVVEADTRLQAISAATRMLRQGVYLRRVTSAEPERVDGRQIPGRWAVVMAVEDEG